MTDFTESAHPFDFRRRQRREGLVVTRQRRAGGWSGGCRYFRRWRHFSQRYAQGVTRLLAIWIGRSSGFVRDIFGCGVRARLRLIRPAAQLRFSPLQIFAQRAAQPVLTGEFVRRRFGRLVGHGTPDGSEVGKMAVNLRF
ncbi:hypothetical protein [Tardiphaga sp.]|uniref:hypothetical protein n=1 Tax=Tardiphaga sp. TaxID=1926292 RepID=UPI00344E55B7